MTQLNEKDIKYKVGHLSRREESLIQNTITMGQKLILNQYVISHWKLTEEIEDICTLEFSVTWPSHKDNMLNNCSYYQVQRNAAGKPVLVRVSK